MPLCSVATLVLPYLTVQECVALACTAKTIFNGPPHPCLRRRVHCWRKRTPERRTDAATAHVCDSPEHSLLRFVRELTVHKPNLHALQHTLQDMTSVTDLCLEFGPPYVRTTSPLAPVDMSAMPLRALRVREPSVRMAVDAVASAVLPACVSLIDISGVHRTDSTARSAVLALAAACAAKGRPVLACACLDATESDVWTAAAAPVALTRQASCRRGWYALHSCDV